MSLCDFSITSTTPFMTSHIAVETAMFDSVGYGIPLFNATGTMLRHSSRRFAERESSQMSLTSWSERLSGARRNTVQFPERTLRYVV